MSIEKMCLVNLIGNMSYLDETLLRCVECELLHPENIDTTSNKSKFSSISEQNPYVEPLNRTEEILDIFKIPKTYYDYSSIKIKDEDISKHVNQLHTSVFDKYRELSLLSGDIDLKQKSIQLVKHMMGLDAKIDDVFKSNYACARFGRLPTESFVKLDYFKNKNFYFIVLDKEEDYCWGVYFMPSKDESEIDEIFKSLYFESYEIPGYIHDKPEIAIKNISEKIRNTKISFQNTEVEVNKIKHNNEEELKALYSKLKMLHDTFNYRKYAVVHKENFRIEGFVPLTDLDKFISKFDDLPVIVENLPVDADSRLTPPVKLKTCWLFKPFEMFVETYGLPRYGDINPSSYIGLIYSILFGIMFGDFGQGICVIAAGVLLWKLKDMALGLILTRCGIFSMIFGLMYGSCFGFEHCFAPIWKAVGLGGIFPLDVLNGQTSMILLVCSLGIGIVIILSAMIINIYLGFKKGDLKSAIFSHNGLAGFLMYGGVVFAAILLLALEVNLFNPVFLIMVVAIPLLCIFFSIPLGKLVSKRKKKDEEKFSIVEAIFEMIEVLMSYCTNTLSFLRVSGFILTHAALMLVVMKFSHMAGSFGSPIVIVVGNIFVMLLEGLIAGIQVLRLIYYETFSRFYVGEGKPFNPIKVAFEKIDKKKK